MAEIDVKDLTLLGNLQQGDKVVGERVDGTTVRLTMPYNIMIGTSNRLTIVNGDGLSGNPTFDISSSYVGQSTITTLGTITTGVWNATTLSVSYGGNGRTTATAYAPICGGTTTTGAHQSSINGLSGQLYVSQGSSALPIWTTPTYPIVSGASGKILQSDGTNINYSTATWPTAATANKFIAGNGTNYVESTSTIPLSAGATANKALLSDGTNYVLSSVTFPNASATTGKYIKSDGTNWIASTTTYPDTGTLNKFLIGDGTNYVESTSTIPSSAGATANKHLKSNGTNYILTTATISDTPSTAGKRLISDGTNWITSTTTMPDTGTTNKALIGNGTNYVESTPTVPFSASATSRKIIVSDGTNWVASTETYAVPSTIGKVMQSDGTNWTSATPTGSGTPVLATSPTMTGVTSDQITWSDTTKGIVGTATNNNAAASYVGEYSTATAGSTSISNNTQTNIVTLSLTAGDWEVWGSITFTQAAGTTATVLIASVSTTSATLGITNSYPQISGVTFAAGSTNILCAAPVRVSLSGISNVYLVGYTTFAVSTMTTTGAIYARRRR